MSKRNVECLSGILRTDYKRRKAIENSGLLYPLWQQARNPKLTPPFLDPDCCLREENGKLVLKTSGPLVQHDGYLRVNFEDNTLSVNTAGQLEVNLHPEGPLIADEDGIDIKTDGTLTVEDWELGVKLDPAEPIDYSSNGLRLHLDETMLVAKDENQRPALGVHLNPIGPITADENGLDLEFDTNALEVREQPGRGGELTLRLAPRGPLAVIEEEGLDLCIDETVFAHKNGMLTLKPEALPSPAHPYCVTGLSLTRTAGTPELHDHSGKVFTKSGKPYRCAYWLRQVNSAGVLSTTVYLNLASLVMASDTPEEGDNDATTFQFWISADPRCNPSELEEGTYYPLIEHEHRHKYLSPARNKYVFDNVFDISLTRFAEDTGGATLTCIPKMAQEPDSLEGHWQAEPIAVTMAPVTLRHEGEYYHVLCFTFTTQTAWLFDRAKKGQMTLGPISFTCDGEIPDPQEIQ
ncbi:fiber-2 [Duck adenovirus 4]|uniref:Fiber-2 n=1 Tax=Duck adenovirus 4 TaxID=2726020 RepID=A0A6M3Q9U5_9ADEN|nr:fiber-2 [Duck adenovirus 4]